MIEYERKIFDLTNIERHKHGLGPLIWSDALANAARAHSADLAKNNLFSHTGSDGSSPEQRVHKVSTIRFAGENISGGRNSPEAAIRDWMASPGHRDNILSKNAVYLGVGAVYAAFTRYRFYVTQVFGA